MSDVGWHFTAGDMTAHDARPIVVGETLRERLEALCLAAIEGR